MSRLPLEGQGFRASRGCSMNTQATHRNAPYTVVEEGGWFYVEDPRTGNRSRRMTTRQEAEMALHSLRIRNLVNE